MVDDVHTPYRIPPSAAGDFARDGFVTLAEVFDRAELAAREPRITAKVRERNTTEDVPVEDRSVLQKAFLQVGNLWRFSQAARDLVFSQRLARIAAELLGVDSVRLFADQALYKEPSGDITPWHADQYYWPLSSDRACTAWIPLQDTPLEMGPLSFAVGSHTFEFGRDMEISEESEQRLHQALREARFDTAQEPFALGDVSFHLGWTFHRAEQNRSATPRRVLTVIYIDAAMRVSEVVHPQQQPQLDLLMPGTAAGELPEGPANPVLFPA